MNTGIPISPLVIEVLSRTPAMSPAVPFRARAFYWIFEGPERPQFVQGFTQEIRYERPGFHVLVQATPLILTWLVPLRSPSTRYVQEEEWNRKARTRRRSFSYFSPTPQRFWKLVSLFPIRNSSVYHNIVYVGLHCSPSILYTRSNCVYMGETNNI